MPTTSNASSVSPARRHRKSSSRPHRTLGIRFYEQRQQLSEKWNVPLAGPGPSNQIGFVDEFHYDAPGTDALCADFAPALEQALKGGG